MTGKTKSIEKTEKTHEGSSSARQSAPLLAQSAFGLTDIQQAAGNLALMQLLRTGVARGKLTVNQPGDVFEQEADKVAERVVSSDATNIAQKDQKAPGADNQLGLIVDDSTPDAGSSQMKRGNFLSQLRAAVNSAAEQAISDSPWAMMMRPQVNQEIEKQFGLYSGLDGRSLENTIRRQVPGAAGATTASGFIPPICEQVRQNIAANLPKDEGITGVAGAVTSAVSNFAQAVGGVISSVGSIFFKAREGGAREADNSQTIRAQLSRGHGLDSRVQTGMASAFGHDFSDVRVHTGTDAAQLADQFNARAFTVGRDIAFGTGEYQPGTLIGDALIAHELAHVVQQSGATASVPLQKGETEHDSLEEEADNSAVSAVVSLWGRTKAGLADMARNATPRLRSGLRLQRCKRAPTPAPTELFNLPSNPNPISAPGEQILFTSILQSLRPLDFETSYTGVGGHFDTPNSGPLEKKFPGIGAKNLPFFIDSSWDGVTPVNVQMQIKRRSDGGIVVSKNWNFKKKPYFPTSIRQWDSEGEQPLTRGQIIDYLYVLGPEVGADGKPRSYQQQTILERFEGVTCNISPSELKPEFKAAHPELTTPEQIAQFYYRAEAFNASFTVDRKAETSDAFLDQNGENNISSAWPVMDVLVTKKDVYFDHPQVFEAEPGVPLGRYIIRRIIKPNGEMAMRKFRA